MRSMASGVVRAAHGLPVVVVSSAPEVIAWARALELMTVDDPGSLDAAAAVGMAWARSEQFDRVVVTHADLPYIRTLSPVLPDGPSEDFVAVPGHRDGGSPVLSIPAQVDFVFGYGTDSFQRHIVEAVRLNLPVRVVRDLELGRDLDTAADLLHFKSMMDRSQERQYSGANSELEQ